MVKKFVIFSKIVLITFLIVYGSSSLIRGCINNKKVINSYIHIQQELERERLTNKELKEKIALTESPEYMELLAREKLGLVKNDEIVYKIVK